MPLYRDSSLCRHRHTIGAETSATALTCIFMHTCMHAHMRARTHANTHARAHAHTDAKVFRIGHVINIHIGMPN